MSSSDDGRARGPSVAGTPSPRLVAAWLVLGTLIPERVPLWAADWLVAGYEGPVLAELAGLRGDDPLEVRALLPDALLECGVPDTELHRDDRSLRRAAVMTAFIALARRYVDGRVSARVVVVNVAEIVELESDAVIAGLPLGRLVGLDIEWGSGRGRTEEQLRDEVARACRDQLQAAQATGRPGPAPDAEWEGGPG